MPAGLFIFSTSPSRANFVFSCDAMLENAHLCRVVQQSLTFSGPLAAAT